MRATRPRSRRCARRKAREEKPFAVMVADLASARPARGGRRRRGGAAAVARAADRAAAKARGHRRRAARRRAGARVAGRDAARHAAAAAAVPRGGRSPAGHARGCEAPQPLVLVMTSANPGGEPLVTGNDEALARLAGIADAWLVHDRDIVIRCDDSVLRALPGRRRASSSAARAATRRGRSRLPRAGPSVVAIGGHFKNTVCVTRGDEAFVSEHVGDLDNAADLRGARGHRRAPRGDPRRRAGGGRARPASRFLQHPPRRAARRAVAACRRYAVQHHHAHVAAVVAEHRRGRVRCWGSRSTASGSAATAPPGAASCCCVDGARCERLGRLRPLRLPGGDRAAREPWRMAAAAFHLRRATGRASRGALPTSRARLPSRRCSSAGSTRRRPAASGAGSTPSRACSTCAGGWPSKARRRCCSRAWPRRTARSPPDRSLYAHRRRQRARPAAAGAARRRPRRPGLCRGVVSRHARLRRWPSGRPRRGDANGLSIVACGGGCMLNACSPRHLRPGIRRRGLGLLEAARRSPERRRTGAGPGLGRAAG